MGKHVRAVSHNPALREVTLEEWEFYKWEEATEHGDSRRFWVKGIRRTEPPDDGYAYYEVTRVFDTAQKWARRLVMDEKVKF